MDNGVSGGSADKNIKQLQSVIDAENELKSIFRSKAKGCKSSDASPVDIKSCGSTSNGWMINLQPISDDARLQFENEMVVPRLVRI